ncbi:Cytochrome p450 protein [Apiospora rasikravindrae]|uniref:Cytochrome p450 protein n=1 Tax=Apiospora rasikravindrae TaxID=990691 RepID=A0ABR1RPM9_9PEZI
MLAGFQTLFINTAEGITSAPPQPPTFKPVNDYERSLCQNQKIRSAQYTSFAVLGMAITYCTGALIIFISFIITPALRHLQRRGRYSKYALLEWEGDTAIQLHRVAQDQLGHGQWSRCDDRVPITPPGNLLAPFDITNPAHPMLARHIEKTRREDNSDGSSGKRPFQQSPLQQGGERSLGHSCVEIRRAVSETHAHGSRESRSHDIHGGLDDCQNRPATAP